jgi:hypothetical protein
MENDTRDTINTVKADVHDGIDEAKNRAQAGGERLSRDVQGDAMPLGDRVASNVKEAGHNIAAGVDKLKRDVRHAGDDTTPTDTTV